MKKHAFFAGSVIALVAALVACQICFAWSSSEFHKEKDEILDDWHICRTNPLGDDGFFQIKETETEVSFRPVIALESLGEYVDVAYEMGAEFSEEYPDRIQRAEEIFAYVQDSIRYTTDSHQFDMPEYAQNADELASILREKGTASADCEEYALLLAVMYQGAGYRSGIVVCPGHAAAILYLPEYQRANQVFTLNGVPGWIWLEATGNNNPFGWFPEGQVEEPIIGYELSPNEHLPLYKSQPPVLDPIGDKEVDKGERLRFSISSTDVNDDPLAYSASNLPEGADFNAKTKTFSWIPDEAGIYPDVHFEVSDGELTDSEDITITVHRINLPPVFDPIGDREVNEGERLRFDISATDANDDALAYSASNLPKGADFNTETRIFSWTPDEAGIYAGIHFEVSDGELTDSEDITITVKSSPKLTVIVIISGIGVVVVVAAVILWRKMRRA